MEQENIQNKLLDNPLIDEYFADQHLGSVSAIGFANEIIAKYFPRQNIYHSGKYHIWPMLKRFSNIDCKEARVAEYYENQFVGYFFALFHDAVDNIIECRKILNQYVNMNGSTKFRRLFEMVHDAIQASAYEFESIHNLTSHVKYCISADVACLLEVDHTAIVENEHLIFREYQKYEYSDFVRQRIATLEKLYRICDLRKEGLELRKIYFERWTPRIAVFAGSFMPFHIGHLNILQQAEQQFDKVIIACGKNFNKSKCTTNNVINRLKHHTDNVINRLKHHQVDSYDGLLTCYLDSKPYPVVLVRALRNSQDLQYEQNLRSSLQDLKPDTAVLYYLCDSSVSHVSSSLCRDIVKYNQSQYMKYTSLGDYEQRY